MRRPGASGRGDGDWPALVSAASGRVGQARMEAGRRLASAASGRARQVKMVSGGRGGRQSDGRSISVSVIRDGIQIAGILFP